jgi:hypothetical protein
MSLNSDLTAIKNMDKLCYVPDPETPENERTEEKGWKMNPITEALIWITMAVDMGEITEKNVDEFYWRLRFQEKFRNYKILIAKSIKDKNAGRGFNPTYKQIRAHIGLKTNAATATRAKFMVRMIRAMEQEMDETLLDELKNGLDKKFQKNGLPA